jgi:LPXTG-motif cell wall-anchored protein
MDILVRNGLGADLPYVGTIIRETTNEPYAPVDPTPQPATGTSTTTWLIVGAVGFSILLLFMKK